MIDEAVARIEEKIDNIKEDVKDTRVDIKDMKETICGKNGIIVNQAVTKTSLTRAWRFIAGIAMIILASAFWIIRNGL